MSNEAARRLAEFTVGTKIGDLSPQALTSAKQLALKTCAGMLAGSSMDAGLKIANFIRSNPDYGQVHVVGHGFKASLWKATFANAFFAHQSELEDDRLTAGTSWDITTYPMLLPLAEIYDMSGADMVESAAVALEVMARTCQFWPQGKYGMSVVPPSVGPSALACRAMGLSAEQTASAFGLAMSGVPITYANFGTDAHFFETSIQTLHGLAAAQGASIGLSSNPDLARFLKGLLGQDAVNETLITAGLGDEWQFTEIWVKKYPCCLYTHRYIDAFLELVRAHELKARDIKRIRVHVAAGAMEVCNRPMPQTVGDLQFSFQHLLAAAARDGDVDYRHIQIGCVTDAELLYERKKVEIIVRDDWKAYLPVETPALLEIEMTGGDFFSSTRQYPTGTLQEPLSTDFVKGLFKKFVGNILMDSEKNFLADILADLQDAKKNDVRRLLAVLGKAAC